MVNLDPEEIALVKSCLQHWAFSENQKEISIMPPSIVTYLSAKRTDYIEKIINKLEDKNTYNL